MLSVYSLPFRMNYKVKYAPNWVFAFLCVAGRVCFVTTDIRWWSATSVRCLSEKYTTQHCEPPEKELSDENGDETWNKKRNLSLRCFHRQHLFTTLVLLHHFAYLSTTLPLATYDANSSVVYNVWFYLSFAQSTNGVDAALLHCRIEMSHWDTNRNRHKYCWTTETFILNILLLLL